MSRVILQSIPVLVFSYTAQVLMKYGVNSVGTISWSLIRNDPAGTLTSLLFNWPVILGFALAGIGAVLYLFVLAQTDLTVALPVLGAIGFLALPVIGSVFLQENVSPMRVMGTLIVAIGMVVVASS